MSDNIQTFEVGDQFRDNDPRLRGNRIVKVEAFAVNKRGQDVARVETVEHWDEALIGRRTWVTVERLQCGRNRQTGYTKVSR